MKILKTKKYSILSGILKYSFVIVFAVIVMTPVVFVSAGGENPGPQVINTTIKNPLGDNGPQDIPSFIKLVVEGALVLGVPIIALAIIYTGFLFVKARGNPEQIGKAKDALLYTLIGAAILLGAFVIANAIGETVNEIKSAA
jgi:hypothetical protein